MGEFIIETLASNKAQSKEKAKQLSSSKQLYIDDRIDFIRNDILFLNNELTPYIYQMIKKFKLFKNVDLDLLDQQADFAYEKKYTKEVDQYYEDRKNEERVRYQAYDKYQCLDKLRQGIMDMWEDGFDFFHSQNVQLANKFKKHDWIRIGLPKFYLRFHCRTCPDKNNKKYKKRWTTSKGTVTLDVKIIPINEFNQQCKKEERIEIKKGQKYSTPFMIFYKFRIYRMMCHQCKKWGDQHMYEPCLLFTVDKLCEKIYFFLTDQKRPRIKRKKLNRLLIKHEPGLCEACQEGVCSQADDLDQDEDLDSDDDLDQDNDLDSANDLD